MAAESMVFTTETSIEMKDPQISGYLLSFISPYNSLYRKVLNQVLHPDYREKYPTDASYVKRLQKDENITKRTANSMLKDVNAKIKALRELKKTELQDARERLKKQKSKKKKLARKIKSLKSKAGKNKATPEELQELREKNTSIYWLNNRINRTVQKIEDLKKRISGERKLSLAFGSKKMFKKQFNLHANHYGTHEDWYRDFVKERDKNIYYVGTKSESNGNLMMQLTYQEEKDCFLLTMTKEKNWRTDGNKFIQFKNLQFHHLREELKQNCMAHKEKRKGALPVSFRIVRRKDRWYLQAMIQIPERPWRTTSFYGTIGLDFNNGFIEASRTNEYGKLVEQRHYDLRFHGSGNKAQSEMEETVCQIVKWCLETGCDLVAEDLDFQKKKAQAEHGSKEKGYNRMLHALDYSRYQTCLENACWKQGVTLKRVNPAWTSRIGAEKYCQKLKLSVHQAASYVIARRGQGFKDHLRSVPKKKKKKKIPAQLTLTAQEPTF